MHLNSDEKVEIFEKYGKGKTDTGIILYPYRSFD